MNDDVEPVSFRTVYIVYTLKGIVEHDQVEVVVVLM